MACYGQKLRILVLILKKTKKPPKARVEQRNVLLSLLQLPPDGSFQVRTCNQNSSPVLKGNQDGN